jgi:hypothetical protein
MGRRPIDSIIYILNVVCEFCQVWWPCTLLLNSGSRIIESNNLQHCEDNIKVAYSVPWRKMKYSRFFSVYISNKVIQVCVITALKVKRYKRKNYPFVIILNIIRLI